MSVPKQPLKSFMQCKESEQVLLQKANALSGLTAKEIALKLKCELPASRIAGKGWLGQALEKCLGATAGSRPLPDFVELGIELKTLAINLKGDPKESTYICVAPIPNLELHWESSLVYRKTRKILWIPILSDKRLPFPESRILTPLLWQPDTETDQRLKQDWEELTEYLSLGYSNQLTAHRGQILQIRPKAANSHVLLNTLDAFSEASQTVPKGFYLRRSFTLQMIRHYFQF